MAFGEILNSSIGFLEVIIIIMLVREVIRLFSGSGKAGTGSSGSGFKDAVGNLWGKTKNKWDKHIEEGNERHKAEEELEKGMIINATEGEHELIRIKDGAIKLRNGFNTPGEFLKVLPDVESKLVRKMNEDSKAFRKNLMKEKEEITQQEKNIDMDIKESKNMMKDIDAEYKINSDISGSGSYSLEERRKAGAIQRQLNELRKEIENIEPQKANALKTFDNARKAIEDAYAKSKPLEDLITLNITNEIKRLIDTVKDGKSSDLSKREHELNDLKTHSYNLVPLIDDIKMHYDREVLANLIRCKEEIAKLKASNEKIFTLYNGITFTAGTKA